MKESFALRITHDQLLENKNDVLEKENFAYLSVYSCKALSNEQLRLFRLMDNNKNEKVFSNAYTINRELMPVLQERKCLPQTALEIRKIRSSIYMEENREIWASAGFDNAYNCEQIMPMYKELTQSHKAKTSLTYKSVLASLKDIIKNPLTTDTITDLDINPLCKPLLKFTSK